MENISYSPSVIFNTTLTLVKIKIIFNTWWQQTVLCCISAVFARLGLGLDDVMENQNIFKYG